MPHLGRFVSVVRKNRWWTLTLAGLVALVLLPIGPFGLAGHALAPGSPLGALLPPSGAHAAPAATVGSLTAPRPMVGGIQGTFFQNNSSFASPSLANQFCLSGCGPGSADPSILHLANGNMGVGYTAITSNYTGSCALATNTTLGMNNVTARIGFSISTDNGVHFGPISYYGNNSCPYYQAFEPSFAVGGSAVYGTFVEANATQYDMTGFFGPAVFAYYPRYFDALAFMKSTTNGTSFSAPKTLVTGGNISRPVLAAVGNTVYIVYENIANGTTALPGSGFAGSFPIQLEFLYSTDGGTTWHGPTTLPGLNTTQGNTAWSPSISLSPNGTVAVAYATNRSCIAFCGTFQEVDGDDLVVATSWTNGTTWKLHTVAYRVGESSYIEDYQFSTLFEFEPATVVSWGLDNSHLYLAWAQATNRSLGGFNSFQDWFGSVLFAGASTDAGKTWSYRQVTPNLDPAAFTETYYNPGLAVAPSGTVELTYQFYDYSGFAPSCGFSSNINGYIRQDLITSPDGVNWSYPINLNAAFSNNEYLDYMGWHSAVAFNATGVPMYVYPAPLSNGLFGFIEADTLVSSTPNHNVTTNVTIVEHGVAAGANWQFAIDGSVFTVNTTTAVVTNVPLGPPAIVTWPGTAQNAGYRTTFSPLIDLPVVMSLAGPTTYDFNFTYWYGLDFNLSFVPPANIFTGNSLFISGTIDNTPVMFSANWNGGGGGTNYFFCPTFPWYFPAGQTLSIGNHPWDNASLYTFVPVNYWNGTGAGSFTGVSSDGNITMNGPINETAWPLAYGANYSVVVAAQGLPSTSTFQFSWNGAPYSSPASSTVTFPGLATGTDFITGVQANSSTSGWEYFGAPATGNPILVPNDPLVNLTFSAFEDVGAPAGTVSFRATGLTNGTVWHLSLNGSEYSSSTPWINLTLHSGNYTVQSFPVVAQNGSVAYAPLSFGPRLNVTVGSTYSVGFSYSFRVTAVAGSGGSISPSGTSWVAPGTARYYQATPTAGFGFAGWTGEGAGAYTGSSLWANFTANGPVVETAAFYPLIPTRFNLTFSESGIPTGTYWSVLLNGVGYSSNQTSFTVTHLYSCTFSGNLGRYSVRVPFVYENATGATRYVPGPYTPQVCGGLGSTVSFSFAPQYYLTLSQTPGGVISITVGPLTFYGSTWVPATAFVGLQATYDPGYQFLGWNGTGPGNYTGPNSIATITLGGPVTETAAFSLVIIPPPQTYWVVFKATVGASTPLPTGTHWSITFAGGNYSSTGSSINVSGLLANSAGYKLHVLGGTSSDGLTEFSPTSYSANVPVTQNITGESIQFGAAYWVSVHAVGDGSASVSPAGPWIADGVSVTINATPGVGAVFSGWAGTGSGSYSGANAQEQITVHGPVTEVATFVPQAPAAKQVTSMWNSGTTWGVLAAVGLLVGLVVGVVVMRMRGPPKGSSPPPSTMNEPVETQVAAPEDAGATGGMPAGEPAPYDESQEAGQ